VRQIQVLGEDEMIDALGWFDWTERDPGPTNKTNPGTNTCQGVVPHSAEGYWPHLGTLVKSPVRRASWMGSNLKDGRFMQHYSVYARTWTSGAKYPNNNFVAWENEGVAGEPLTDLQVDNIVRIIRELSEKFHWTPERPSNPRDVSATCYEHNECVRWGAEPTACPSGRIPWPRILAALKPKPKGDDDMPYLAWDKDRSRVYLIGPTGAKWIVDAGKVAQLEADLGKMAVAYSATTIEALT
jgi:hypothetical protein